MSTRLFGRWRRMLESVREEQLQDLLINRHIFAQLCEVVAPYVGTCTGGEVEKFVQQGYLAFATTAVRRMVEEPRSTYQSVSFVILLRDLQRHSSLLTLDRFRAPYEEFCGDDRVVRIFHSIARSKATVISANRSDRDIRTLKRATAPVLRMVNKVIAHTEHDRRRLGKMRYPQLDHAIDRLLETYMRYNLLLNQADGEPVPLEAIDVRPDWRKIWP